MLAQYESIKTLCHPSLNPADYRNLCNVTTACAYHAMAILTSHITQPQLYLFIDAYHSHMLFSYRNASKLWMLHETPQLSMLLQYWSEKQKYWDNELKWAIFVMQSKNCVSGQKTNKKCDYDTLIVKRAVNMSGCLKVLNENVTLNKLLCSSVCQLSWRFNITILKMQYVYLLVCCVTSSQYKAIQNKLKM